MGDPAEHQGLAIQPLVLLNNLESLRSYTQRGKKIKPTQDTKVCISIPVKGAALAQEHSVYGRGRFLFQLKSPVSLKAPKIHAEISCQYFKKATFGPFAKGSN